jgi:hypothetical protein
MGWRENGEAMAWSIRIMTAVLSSDPRHELLRRALRFAKTGDSAPLEKHLEMAPSSGQYERELVAEALKARALIARRTRRRGGRPPELAEKYIAQVALNLYTSWCFVNKLQGESARGHHEEMKGLAASYAIEPWLPFLPISNDKELHAFWEKVCSLMGRASSRRKLPADLRAKLEERMQRFFPFAILPLE